MGKTFRKVILLYGRQLWRVSMASNRPERKFLRRKRQEKQRRRKEKHWQEKNRRASHNRNQSNPTKKNLKHRHMLSGWKAIGCDYGSLKRELGLFRTNFLNKHS